MVDREWHGGMIVGGLKSPAGIGNELAGSLIALPKDHCGSVLLRVCVIRYQKARGSCLPGADKHGEPSRAIEEQGWVRFKG